jgi:hypothetical protein
MRWIGYIRVTTEGVRHERGDPEQEVSRLQSECPEAEDFVFQQCELRYRVVAGKCRTNGSPGPTVIYQLSANGMPKNIPSVYVKGIVTGVRWMLAGDRDAPSGGS